MPGREREQQPDDDRTYDAERAILRLTSEEASVRGSAPKRLQDAYPERPGR